MSATKTQPHQTYLPFTLAPTTSGFTPGRSTPGRSTPDPTTPMAVRRIGIQVPDRPRRTARPTAPRSTPLRGMPDRGVPVRGVPVRGIPVRHEPVPGRPDVRRNSQGEAERVMARICEEAARAVPFLQVLGAAAVFALFLAFATYL